MAKREITKQDVTIVIPTWNEAEAIGQVIDELRGYGYENILVVDGYSTDGTPEIAAQKAVRVVKQTGQGKTGALATAVHYIDTPYVLVIDGDYTYDPSGIETIMAHARTYEEVIGARVNGRNNIPLINRLGNRLLTWFFRTMFVVNLTDVCSGMYMIRTETLQRLDFTTGGFDAEVEIAAQVSEIGRVTQVPVTYRPRVGRQKLSSFKHGITIAISILRLSNVHNPVLLYSTLMALAGIPGLAIVAWVMYERLYLNIWHSGFVLFGMMLLVVASQSVAVATISLMLKRSERRLFRTLKEHF